MTESSSKQRTAAVQNAEQRRRVMVWARREVIKDAVRTAPIVAQWASTRPHTARYAQLGSCSSGRYDVVGSAAADHCCFLTLWVSKRLAGFSEMSWGQGDHSGPGRQGWGW